MNPITSESAHVSDAWNRGQGNGLLNPGAMCNSGARTLRRPFARWAAIAVSVLVFLGTAQSSAGNVIVVTTLTDKVSSTGGCSLKEAIYSSTLHDTFDGVHGLAIDYTDPDHFITTECALGSGNDTIILPTGYPLPVFELTSDTSWDAHNPYGFTATPIINSNITIQGDGATLQWAGTGNVRLFAVGPATITTPNGVSSGTGSLTLLNVHITGFQAKGGDGADGGGGGLGAGGAIYIQNGNLTIQNSTFDSNVATGGNGATGAYILTLAGGGGGGLGGNGGPSPSATGGGGGGGSRGNGGVGSDGGGGGGGTVNNGASTTNGALGPGGYLCGGDGGSQGTNSGDNARCPGGGGGGDGYNNPLFGISVTQNSGGNGAYGGGGGGGQGQGGNGGFGGGGGAISSDSGQGGNGGFGGGGGLGAFAVNGGPGQGGAFGGNGNDLGGGGGGGALGGAIFSDSATVRIENSTFYNNSLLDGQGGGGGNSQVPKADNGGAAGAIFARDGSLTIIDSTISGNQADGSGAGVVVYSDGSASLTLNDTIIANNGANECYVAGKVTVSGVGNLIMSNGSGSSFNPCPGVVTTSDPQLGPLQLNAPGITPTMAISTSSSAFNAADATTSLSTDQRGVDRPQDGGYDVGAYEACPPPHVFGGLTCVILTKAPPPDNQPLTVQITPAGVGTVSPPAGVDEEPNGSLVLLSASVPNPQYQFVGWTGSVADPANQVTTILMDGPQTVTATFTLNDNPTLMQPYVSIVRSGYVYNFGTGRFVQTVRVTNTASFNFIGPIDLMVYGLSSNATLFNASNHATFLQGFVGNPYITANAGLAPGQSVTFTLQFTDLTKAAISYEAFVFAGPGVF